MILTLVEKKKEAGDAITFVWQPQTPFSWIAGQYLFYTFPHDDVDDRGVTRYFTISAAPFEKNVHITTRISQERSSFKDALNKIKIGGKIEATDPDGDFIVDDPGKNSVFVSGGIGITPYRSILLDLDHKNLPINAILLYANSDENFVFRQELETLAAKHPTLKIKYIISPKHIERADIEQAITEIGNNPIVWFSGPEKMTEAFEKLLKEDMEISEDRLKFDYFPGYDPIK